MVNSPLNAPFPRTAYNTIIQGIEGLKQKGRRKRRSRNEKKKRAPIEQPVVFLLPIEQSVPVNSGADSNDGSYCRGTN
jgi:hypothetical protein